MSAYTLWDFSETVNHYNSPIKGTDIKKVIAAWGNGGSTEWEGGFLLQLKDKRYMYIWGWNDYSGWGCQDGIEYKFYDKKPKQLEVLRGRSTNFGTMIVELMGDSSSLYEQEWDMDPADLNKWVKEGADTEKAWL